MDSSSNTTQQEYVPIVASTTTTTQSLSTTTCVCTVVSHNLSMAVRVGRAETVPQIGYTTNGGCKGAVRFSSITILTVPSPNQGQLILDGVVLTNGASINASQNGRLTFKAFPGFSGATFTYAVVTTCGTSSTMTGTVTVEAEPTGGCVGCGTVTPTTTNTTSSTTTTTT